MEKTVSRIWPGVLFFILGMVLAILARFRLSWPGFGIPDPSYNLTICEIDVICVQP